MDDLKIAEIPQDDPEVLDKLRAQGIRMYAEQTVTIPFDKHEIYDLCKLLESIAVGDPNYHRVAECAVFVEKIRARWTAADLDRRSSRRKRG